MEDLRFQESMNAENLSLSYDPMSILVESGGTGVIMEISCHTRGMSNVLLKLFELRMLTPMYVIPA